MAEQPRRTVSRPPSSRWSRRGSRVVSACAECRDDLGEPPAGCGGTRRGISVSTDISSTMLERPRRSASILAPLAVVFAAVAVAGCRSVTAGATAGTPQTARLITEDIPRFWSAFDSIRSSTDSIPLRLYLDAGTQGLK